MKRITIAAVVAACAALALPAAASAESALVLGFQVTSVDAGQATGIMHCVDPTHAGQQATFPIGPYANASLLVPGAVIGIRVERNTIVGTNAQPPCELHLDTPPAGAPAPGWPDPSQLPAGEQPSFPPPGAQGDPGAVKGPGGNPGDGNKDGLPHNGPGNGRGQFMPGFANRVWKFNGSADGFDDGKLSITLEKILNLPKRFASQDDDLVDEDAIVLVGKKTKIRDADGHRATAADLDDADEVRVDGKLLPPKKWETDEDGQPVTTIRAKRVVIVS
jgi:hypothetical protein